MVRLCDWRRHELLHYVRKVWRLPKAANLTLPRRWACIGGLGGLGSSTAGAQGRAGWGGGSAEVHRQACVIGRLRVMQGDWRHKEST